MIGKLYFNVNNVTGLKAWTQCIQLHTVWSIVSVDTLLLVHVSTTEVQKLPLSNNIFPN